MSAEVSRYREIMDEGEAFQQSDGEALRFRQVHYFPITGHLEGRYSAYHTVQPAFQT